jgi:hypothetical protein
MLDSSGSREDHLTEERQIELREMDGANGSTQGKEEDAGEGEDNTPLLQDNEGDKEAATQTGRRRQRCSWHHDGFIGYAGCPMKLLRVYSLEGERGEEGRGEERRGEEGGRGEERRGGEGRGGERRGGERRGEEGRGGERRGEEGRGEEGRGCRLCRWLRSLAAVAGSICAGQQTWLPAPPPDGIPRAESWP